jgi:serine/threonine-protein kinase
MNIGDRIGDYEIVATLGSGGMGQVYKVRNALSQRIEAMKVLLPNLEADPALADRFLREIKMQAALDHPNIAKLHTAMRVDNQLLMFMEFIDGTTLARLIESGPLPAGEAAAYTAQALDALAYAHAQGVVHRDIKPANLMITSAGVVKLMDFGIARLHDDTRLTKTGGTVGSLSYMSPEQIRGAEPDPRSDIYSLGITLYEMVTGKRPFAGVSDYQLMSAHLQQVPAPPISIVPGIPGDLNEIILMAIAKQPEGRFQSAGAFRGALVSVFSGIAPPLAAPMPAASPAVVPAAPVIVPPPAANAASPTQAATVTATALRPVSVPPPLPAAPPPPAVAAPGFQAQAAQPSSVMASFPSQASPSVTPSGRRGLYMALGSIVTVVVLIAAVIEGPKLMHGGSSGAATATQQTSNVVSTPVSAPLVPAADATTPAADAPAAASDIATVSPAAAPFAQTAAPTGQTGGTAATPARLTTAAAQQRSQQAPPTNLQQAGQAAPPAAPEPWHRLNGAPAAPDAGQLPAQNPPTQAAPPPPARPAVNPEAAQLRNQLNELSIRANTARSGLQSFQQQQSRQGLGLRADIREAQTRLDFQLQESMMALQAGDFETARTSMRYAQSAVETIEKFLGR